MRIIRKPRLRTLRRKSLYLHTDATRPCPTLYYLHRNTPIYILERANPRPRRTPTRAHPHRAGTNMPAPVRKRPQPLRSDDLRLVVRDPDQLRVCGAALHADPVEVRRHVCLSEGVVDVSSPEQALTCGAAAATGEPGCPCALEIGVFRLPDGVFGVDGGVGGAGV
jgi:hypothetical protein